MGDLRKKNGRVGVNIGETRRLGNAFDRRRDESATRRKRRTSGAARSFLYYIRFCDFFNAPVDFASRWAEREIWAIGRESVERSITRAEPDDSDGVRRVTAVEFGAVVDRLN